MLPEVANKTGESELIDLEVQGEVPSTSGIYENELKGSNKRSSEVFEEEQPFKVLRLSDPVPTESLQTNLKLSREEEWLLEVSCFLENKNWTKLHSHLLKMPNLSPESFHKLIISLNYANQLGLSPSEMEPLLLQAISSGVEVQEKTLEILSQAKINFNKVDEKSRNILFLAVKHNLGVPVLRNLIKKGANVKQVDIHGHNLLHWAAAHGSIPDVIKFLIRREVKVNKMDGEGETPVFKLKYLTNPERKLGLFKLFANSGGDIYKKNLNGETPLHVCFEGEIPPKEFKKIVEFLVEKMSMSLFNVGDNSKKTPFHLFLKSFEIDKETLKLLATAGVKFTFVDETGNGVLHYAIEGNQSPEILLGLVENGASPKIINRFRETLLHFAIKNSSTLPTFQFLLERVRVDITSVNGEGETVLHCALSHKEKLSEEVLTKIFISTVNSGIVRFDEWDEPILQTVAKYGSPEALNKTLDKLKNVNESAPDGMTAFLCACQSWRPSQAVEKAEILRAHGAEVKSRTKNGMTALHHAALQGSKDILKYLLELGLDLEATDKFGNTPLLTILTKFSFAQVAQVEKAKYFLEKGANANAKNKKLQTPLHLALKACKNQSSMEFLNLLLKSGADVNAPGEHGWTSIHVAVNCPEKVSLQLLNFLVESGATTNARTWEGQTILHFAAEKASLKTIRFCLEKGFSVNAMGNRTHTPIHLFLQKLPSAVIQGKLQPEDCLKTMKLLLGATRASQNTRNDLRKVIQFIIEKIESSARFAPLVEVYKKIDQLLGVKVKIVSEKYKTI